MGATTLPLPRLELEEGTLLALEEGPPLAPLPPLVPAAPAPQPGGVGRALLAAADPGGTAAPAD